MEHLALEETEEYEMAGEGEEEVGSNLSLCLVGRFLTDKSIRVNIIMDKMAEIWRPGRGCGDQGGGVGAVSISVLSSV